MPENLIIALLCTLSMVIGWLVGNNEARNDLEVTDELEWREHYRSALWVARRTPDGRDEA